MQRIECTRGSRAYRSSCSYGLVRMASAFVFSGSMLSAGAASAESVRSSETPVEDTLQKANKYTDEQASKVRWELKKELDESRKWGLEEAKGEVTPIIDKTVKETAETLRAEREAKVDKTAETLRAERDAKLAKTTDALHAEREAKVLVLKQRVSERLQWVIMRRLIRTTPRRLETVHRHGSRMRRLSVKMHWPQGLVLRR